MLACSRCVWARYHVLWEKQTWTPTQLQRAKVVQLANTKTQQDNGHAKTVCWARFSQKSTLLMAMNAFCAIAVLWIMYVRHLVKDHHNCYQRTNHRCSACVPTAAHFSCMQDRDPVTPCALCALGMFQYDQGQTACQTCEVGTQQMELGADSSFACYYCPAGRADLGEPPTLVSFDCSEVSLILFDASCSMQIKTQRPAARNAQQASISQRLA